MLKKLRRRFILINMLTVGAIIVAIFIAICVNTYVGAADDITRSLRQTMTAEPDNTEHPRIGTGKPDDTRRMVACVTVLLRKNGQSDPAAPETASDIGKDGKAPSEPKIDFSDTDGEIVKTYEQNATIDKNVLESAVDAVIESGKQEGKLPSLGLIYVCSGSPDGIKISFADSSEIYSQTKNTVMISIALGTLSLAALFGVSVWLSGVAIKPAKLAWTQQRQFVSDASHELKTPLTVILANSDLLLSSDTVADSDRKWLQSTKEEAERMKELTERLLFLARSDENAIKPCLEKTNISDLIESCELSFEPIAFEKGVSVETHIEQDMYAVTDQKLVMQLLHILIDNAVKYSPKGQAVDISLTADRSLLHLSVKNGGEPLSAEDLEHIFDRFYRSDKARSGGGHGLGLSIAKSLSDLLGCGISAKSSEDTGTVFTITLKRG